MNADLSLESNIIRDYKECGMFFRHKTAYNTMRRIILFIVSVSLISCSIWGDNESQGVRITNNTDQPIIYNAMERQAANLYDPKPEIQVDEFSDDYVHVGETVKVKQIEKWEKGESIRFFLYTAPEGEETAIFKSVYDVKHQELKAQSNRVIIDTLTNRVIDTPSETG